MLYELGSGVLCQFDNGVFAMLDPAPRHYYRAVKVGQTVRFPCPTKLPEDIYWARLGLVDGRKTEIYWGNFGPRDLGLNPRFKVMHNQSNSLVIYNVTVDDSANYQCIEDSGLGNEHFYLLNVQGNFILFSFFTSMPESLFYFTDVLFYLSVSTKFLGVL